MNTEEQLANALDACFVVMMQFTLEQPWEGDKKPFFSVPYDASVIIESRAIAERMYYEAHKKYANSKP